MKLKHFLTIQIILLPLFSCHVQAIDPVYPISIPGSVYFCGEKINLNRNDLRERFDKEQTIIAYSHSASILILKKANKFLPIIELILKENGIPDDFKYLAVIESGLEQRAISPVGAASIWQLMPNTAKELGLIINEDVDERYNLEKATSAACTYFKKAYNKFKDWPSVAASYNGGMKRISDELQNQRSTTALDLLLTNETSRYMFRILAMKEFLENPKRFGYMMSKEDFYPTVRTTITMVNTSIDNWAEWLTEFGITYYQLKEFNPWLRTTKLSNSEKNIFQIKIPVKEDLIYNPTMIIIHNQNWIEPIRNFIRN